MQAMTHVASCKPGGCLGEASSQKHQLAPSFPGLSGEFCAMQIKGLLVGWARDACVSSLSNLQERLRLIQDRPLDLAGFVAYQVCGRMVKHTKSAVGSLVKLLARSQHTFC